MNTHVKIQATDLSRRSFLVGSAATGLVLGYAAVPGIDQALAAPSAFEPSVWYSIAPDGLVTVTCGKADMGQHIASTMAQIVAEELGASWKDMRVQLASNDPKFNDPVLGAQITGGSWSTMMNFDAMSRAGAAGRIALTEAAASIMGVPAGELVVRNSTVSHPKSKKSMSFADIVKSGKATKTFTPDELKALEERATGAIDIVEFLPAEQVDRIYLDRTYFLGPDKGGERSYKLLAEALKKTNRVAIGQYAARGKQYLIMVRPLDGGLAMEQLRYADEIRKISEVPIPKSEVKKPELDLAIKIIEQGSTEEFQPAKYKDNVRDRMMEQIEGKVKGKQITEEPEEAPKTKVLDLMQALKQSLGAERAEEKEKPAKRRKVAGKR